MLEALKQIADQELSETLTELRPEEAAVLGLLQQRLTRNMEQVRTTEAEAGATDRKAGRRARRRKTSTVG
jgi:DNA topoisomerase I